RAARHWQDDRVGPLMLLDTASLYFRAYYGVPDTLTAPDGTPVNAVRGLLGMIARLVRARHPGQLVACLDADWRPPLPGRGHPPPQGPPGPARWRRGRAARAGRAGAGDRGRARRHRGCDGGSARLRGR